MDLQKVKGALISAESTLSEDGYNCTFIREALAELEKPVDDKDADKVASDIEEIQFLLNDGSVMARRHARMVDLIQQYAESYHAKKCAECDHTVWCATCGDPITIGVCENCVPDMFDDYNIPKHRIDK